MSMSNLEALKQKILAKKAAENKEVPKVAEPVKDVLDTPIADTPTAKLPPAPPVKIAPLRGADIIKGRIAELAEHMEARIPGYEQILRQIHMALMGDPDAAHLLTDEEISVIVAALSRKTAINIAVSASKSGRKSNTAKKLSEIGADDL